MIPKRVPSDQKPLRANLIKADFFRWPTTDQETKEPTGRHVICVTGYRGVIMHHNSVRTSWVERLFETEEGRFVETRNSRYGVDLDDTLWKLLHDEMKHELLDVERMKK